MILIAQEKNLENKVKDFLKKHGCWYVKYWGGGGFTKSGIPDLLICCNGYFIGCELKSVRGKPTELQVMNLTNIQRAGGLAVLLYPQNFELFKLLIANIMDANGTAIQKTMEKFNQVLHKWRLFYAEEREGLCD